MLSSHPSRPHRRITIQSSYVFTHSTASLTLPRTPFCGQRWDTSSLKKKMPPSKYFGTSAWCDWTRADHITGMSLGLSVSVGPSPFLWVYRFPPLLICLPRHFCKKFVFDSLGDHINTCTSHSGTKKTNKWVVDQSGVSGVQTSRFPPT